MGATVKHRSRVRRDPTRPNLGQGCTPSHPRRAARRAAGSGLRRGSRPDGREHHHPSGVDLLGLPVGATLHIGGQVAVELTGLRSCGQLNGIQPGLMRAVLDRDGQGRLIRKAGVMPVVLTGGEVRPGDTMRMALRSPPHRPLQPI